MSRYIVILCTFLVLASCETYFKPPVNKVVDAISVEGLITDKPGKNFVRISLGIGFTDSVHYEEVDRYNVRIESDKGDVFYLTEYYRGFYRPDNDKSGEVGKSYRVVVESKDGENVYQSDWDLMNACAPIDTMYGQYGVEKVLRYNKVTGYYEESLPGIEVLASTNTNSYTPYYRYEYDLVYLNIQSYPTELAATYFYCTKPWTSQSTNYISVASGLDYSSKNIIKRQFGFVYEKYMDKEYLILGWDVDSEGNRVFPESSVGYQRGGVLVKLKQYSLSERGFNFWDAINNQKNASGQIFDPVISQVQGNIRCVSNPEELVFGNFGASAINEYSIHVNLKQGNRVTVSPTIYFPDLNGETIYPVQPDFWVY